MPDPFGQLAGCLAGEGQPEDPVRGHQTVGDQVDDPTGHRLALLPDPAPARTSPAVSGASMMARCSAVGGGWSSTTASQSADQLNDAVPGERWLVVGPLDTGTT